MEEYRDVFTSAGYDMIVHRDDSMPLHGTDEFTSFVVLDAGDIRVAEECSTGR